MTARRITTDAAFLAFALVMYMVESLLPPLFVLAPGVKIGLGNIFVFLTIVFCGGVDGLIVAVLKSLLGSIFSGNMAALMYSLPSAFCSACCMIFLCKFFLNRFSVLAISVLSSAVFNLVQVVMSSIILSSWSVIAYLPYIILLGSVSGLFTGAVSYFIIKHAKFLANNN